MQTQEEIHNYQSSRNYAEPKTETRRKLKTLKSKARRKAERKN